MDDEEGFGEEAISVSSKSFDVEDSVSEILRMKLTDLIFSLLCNAFFGRFYVIVFLGINPPMAWFINRFWARM